MSGTKQLFILRHAKSSWDDPGLDDHERPLAPRGHRAVKILAEHMREKGIQPAQVLCSSSRRTRETLDGVAVGGEHIVDPELYWATAEEVMARLRRVPDDVASVMVVGHNPAMQLLALRLAAADGAVSDGHARAAVQAKFPTGALATLSFKGRWTELEPACARMVEFVSAKELGRKPTSASKHAVQAGLSQGPPRE